MREFNRRDAENARNHEGNIEHRTLNIQHRILNPGSMETCSIDFDFRVTRHMTRVPRRGGCDFYFVENENMVVLLKVFPGRRMVEGKLV